MAAPEGGASAARDERVLQAMLDEVICAALKQPCDRDFVLRLESELEDFHSAIRKEKAWGPKDVLVFPHMNSYKRLLVHKIAERFQMMSESVGTGEDRQTAVGLRADSQVPRFPLSDFLMTKAKSASTRARRSKPSVLMGSGRPLPDSNPQRQQQNGQSSSRQPKQQQQQQQDAAKRRIRPGAGVYVPRRRKQHEEEKEKKAQEDAKLEAARRLEAEALKEEEEAKRAAAAIEALRMKDEEELASGRGTIPSTEFWRETISLLSTLISEKPLVRDKPEVLEGRCCIHLASKDYAIKSSEDTGKVPSADHLVELFDFPSAWKEDDIHELLSAYKTVGGYTIRWVDSTRAIIIFKDERMAEDAVRSVASEEAQLRIVCEETLKPLGIRLERQFAPSRPATTTVVARRLVGHALGIRT